MCHAAFELEIAFGDVVHDAIAGDVPPRLRFSLTYLAVDADDHAELDLPVGLGRSRGNRTSSLGPMIALVAFMNRTGSGGTTAPVSAA